jgi:hypothetical protein
MAYTKIIPRRKVLVGKNRWGPHPPLEAENPFAKCSDLNATTQLLVTHEPRRKCRPAPLRSRVQGPDSQFPMKTTSRVSVSVDVTVMSLCISMTELPPSYNATT